MTSITLFRFEWQVRDQMAADGIKPFDEWIPQTDLPAESEPCNTGPVKSNVLLTE